MATVGDDCYFYCTSTCAKGATCPFRHVEAAKTNKVICQHWQMAGCFRPMCKFRHSDFHIQVNYSEVPCYWESQSVGCSKANCPYKHNKPRPDTNPDSPQVIPDSLSQKDESNKNDEKKDSADAFVMPTVKPIIIDPESEASNSSPVKHPPSKATKEESPENEIKVTETSDKKKELKSKGNGEVVEGGKGKKGTKVVGKKKKGILTQKNGKPTGTAKVKKVKREFVPSPAKLLVKRKKVEDIKEEKNSEVAVKKRVKERIGLKPTAVPDHKEEESDDDDSSDSDDSIENVKVLSMEEIFRQKALESMMKKRAAEGKPMLPEYSTSKKKSTVRSEPSKSNNLVKPMKQAVKKLPTPPPPTESEEEEESEEEDDSEEEERIVTEEKEDQETDDENDQKESSGSNSDLPSSSSFESEDDKVRRVVIDLDAEKTARDRAKASLRKNHHVNAPVSSSSKLLKRKVIREKSHTASFLQDTARHLSIKERLGKFSVSSKSEPTIRSVSSKINTKLSSEDDETDKSNDDYEHLSDVNIKSLEEIKQEKFKKFGGNSPIKERLGPAKVFDEDEEEKSGRQILISEDLSSPKKKAKKRPWSSGRNTTGIVQNMGYIQEMREDVQETREEDQRTVSASSLVDIEPDSEAHLDEPECPFERLKRRAFMKKTQQFQEETIPETKEEESEGGEVGEAVSGKRKKHKHKHKHKHHKKSKKERQIYVPPAKKSYVVIGDVPEQDKKKLLKSSASTIVSKPDIIPEYEEEEDINCAVPMRPKSRAAAFWAAGLTIPSKGLGGRPHLRAGVDKSDDVQPQKPSIDISKITTSLSSASAKDSSVPVVKTFSQIMAEKRQKRQQVHEKKGFDEIPASAAESLSNSSSPYKMSPKIDDSRPRVPITPITFDRRETGDEHPLRAKPAVSVAIHNDSSKSASFPSRIAIASRKSSPANDNVISSAVSLKSSVALSDIRPTYKTARAKKLFKKTKAPSETSTSPVPSDTSIHISPQGIGSTYAGHQHRKSTENTSNTVPSGDIAFESPTDGKKQRRTSTSAQSNSKQSTSLDDEFSFFDGGDMIEDIGDIVDKDVEPIDDLLQDIDDLLA